MTIRTETEVSLIEGRINAIRMTDSERLVAMAAMRNGFMMADGIVWLARKITQVGASLFSRQPTLAR